ncbi:ATP-binding protein [Nanoarchaeota archaeon]
MFSLQPITREHCYSQPQLDQAIKSIRSKNNILITAPEKTGKSTFLLHLSKKLDQKFTPVIFSSQNAITLGSYIRSNLLKLLSAHPDLFENPKELFTISFLDLDKRLAETKLGDAAKQSLKLLLLFEKDDTIGIDQVIKTFFMFPQILSSETKKPAVVMVDDAEQLSTIKHFKKSLSVFFDLLSSKDLNSTIFVLASSQALPLEGFEQLELKPFTIDSAREFFTKNKLELDEPALNTIYNTTGGVPFYLNFFARYAKMTDATDTESINNMLEESLNNELDLYFSEKLKLLSPKELPILFCMAQHKVNTPSRISRLLNYSQTNVRRFLSIMEEKGFVSLKERGVFEIHDPVFRRWLEVQASRLR